MKTVICTIGCRPDAIKMMPLIMEMKTRRNIKTVILSTGQHREMLDSVFEQFGIYPDFDLNIMKPEQSLFDITINILQNIQAVLEEVNPDLVLVHGDTSTAFATALACFYKKIPLGHVEAGLRTRDIYSPFPEEFNRQTISMIADYNFAPTQLAKAQLINEGVSEEKIWVTGNTVIDAMQHTVDERYSHPELEWASDSRLIFITAHRRENLGEPMRRMFKAIRCVLNEFSDVKAIYPIHMNPQIRNMANEELGDCEKIHIIEPISVFDCHNFEARTNICLTDSGGIQEECPSYGVPVLVMRDTTERPEGLDAGVLKLVGTNEKNIYETLRKLLEDQEEYEKMSNICNPFGDGLASKRIADVIEFGNCKQFI